MAFVMIELQYAVNLNSDLAVVSTLLPVYSSVVVSFMSVSFFLND